MDKVRVTILCAKLIPDHPQCPPPPIPIASQFIVPNLAIFHSSPHSADNVHNSLIRPICSFCSAKTCHVIHPWPPWVALLIHCSFPVATFNFPIFPFHSPRDPLKRENILRKHWSRGGWLRGSIRRDRDGGGGGEGMD